jgi:hypothetical protein
MMWRVSDGGIILDGDRVVGSLVKVGDCWSVEILWSASAGDLRFISGNYEACLAYVSGACAMATRLMQQR